jgi:phosphate transport system protein
MSKNPLPNDSAGLYTDDRAEGESMVRYIDSELQQLKDLALQMGGCAEKALEMACAMVEKRQPEIEGELNALEQRINSLQMAIDEACVRVLAKQAPVAKDLRLVIAITRINTDLERMGDQSVNIALSARDLFRQWPQVHLPEPLPRMMEEVRLMVHDVLNAFSRRDTVLSEAVLKRDDVVDRLRDQMVQHMVAQIKSQPERVEMGLSFIMIAKNLERLADHATNIAEEVIYFATGHDVRHGQSKSVNS